MWAAPVHGAGRKKDGKEMEYWVRAVEGLGGLGAGCLSGSSAALFSFSGSISQCLPCQSLHQD